MGCCGGGSEKPKPKEDVSFGETISKNKAGIVTGVIVALLVGGLFWMVL